MQIVIFPCSVEFSTFFSVGPKRVAKASAGLIPQPFLITISIIYERGCKETQFCASLQLSIKKLALYRFLNGQESLINIGFQVINMFQTN